MSSSLHCPCVPGINKHFIAKHTDKVIVLLNQKQNFQFMSRLRVDSRLRVSDQQHMSVLLIRCYQHTKNIHPFRFFIWWSGESIAKDFLNVNQQVVWHQYGYLFMGFTSGFRKEKETVPFQCSISSRPYGKQGFIPASQFSFSQNVEEKCHSLLLLPPATVQMLGKAKMKKWNKKKTLKNKFCISGK